MDTEYITIQGARENNLKNIDLKIPRDKLVVITGLSGSGKSSLAFDTIYAEGQRRYVECLSAYARQFLGGVERPDVDNIEGLSPAISIEQKTVSRSVRSTVGTVTEIYDYLRLLFARAGIQHCPKDGAPVQRQSLDQMIDNILGFPQGSRILILAPVVRGRKGHYRELFDQVAGDGFTKVRVDGVVQDIEPGMQVDRYKVHNIEVVVDRLVVNASARPRLSDSMEMALRIGDGVVIVETDGHDMLMSVRQACPVCGSSYEDLAPNSFSFNSPYGACPVCDGLGEKKEFDIDLMIPDPTLTFREGGLAVLGKPQGTWWWSEIRAIADRFGFDLETRICDLDPVAYDVMLHGSSKEKYRVMYQPGAGRARAYDTTIPGLIKTLNNQYMNTSSVNMREWVESFMRTQLCPACKGGRLKPESLAVRLGGSNISEITALSIRDAAAFLRNIALTPRQEKIGHQIVKEISSRLDFLVNVGLEYLTLDRSARSLSGGEAQRIRLATQIGTQLVGVLYILDEPSIGLHQRDNMKLIDSLKQLRDLGNSVIVVEHDREMIESADHIIDLGPGAGEFGGWVVAEGTGSAFRKNGKGNGKSLTVEYLTNKRRIDPPGQRRTGNGGRLLLSGAAGHNLKNVDLEIPLGTLCCISGVSGSGKSSLINETLYPIIANHHNKARLPILPYGSIEGLELIDKVIDIDQNPIGRTPRSNPATYTGVFTLIRDLFTNLPEAKIRGYAAGRFSFNVEGGRCDACNGDGVRKIEMNFLPDVYVACEVCKGLRYNRETIEVRYHGQSIADVLNMTVEEALSFFSEIHRISRKLQTLHDVGLGYIRLGQQATTLSGGEAQRVKLAAELAKLDTGRTVYILDEPTTGLHFEDVRMLLDVLNKLVDKGNTVIVIEHNLDVIKTADWVIDLGPAGGDAGGFIVAQGPPEHIAQVKDSHTGRFLAGELAAVKAA
jgi:excinuclease ABC subunit A